jgi:nucleoside-diphosphate-sugar epimerase
VADLLILGAGYVGAALGQQALARGHRVTLADNWYATERSQLEGLEALGAEVRTADIRERPALDELLATPCDCVYLLAAQASRPLSETDPDYTEETNLTGARRVAQAVATVACPRVVYGSSLHVYGPAPDGEIGPAHPYGPQGDLAHLSKVYAELCLELYARRHGFSLALARLGIVYGPSPVEHDHPESQTVVDKFRRLASAGEPLPVEGGGTQAIGVVHVEDVARILLEMGDGAERGPANVVAETITVAGVAALARGEAPPDAPPTTYVTPFQYRHDVAEYLRP